MDERLFIIQREEFCGDFELPDQYTIEHVTNVEPEEENQQQLIKYAAEIIDNQERLLVELLIEAGVTWAPVATARFLLSRGVRVAKISDKKGNTHVPKC